MAPSETGRTAGHVVAGAGNAVTAAAEVGSERDAAGVSVAGAALQATISAARAKVAGLSTYKIK